jgi:hypothetical protein
MNFLRRIKSAADNWAERVLKHTYMGWLLAAATLLGGWNPFIQSKPRLSALVDTDRTFIFSNRLPALLQLSAGARAVNRDVSTATILIWNQGDNPIRNTNTQSNMLDQFLIQTAGNVPILDASVLNQTRDVIEFHLLKDQMAQGKLSATWNTLENEDGVRLQIVYAGPPASQFMVTGIPELQKGGVVQYSRLSFIDHAYVRWMCQNPFILEIIILVGAFLSAWTCYSSVRLIRESSGFNRLAFIFLLPPVLIVALSYFVNLILLKIPNVPYGI